MYNLHSHKQNAVEIPIEIELTEDKQFIKTILKRTSKSDIAENMSDSDTSKSDLDCSGSVSTRILDQLEKIGQTFDKIEKMVKMVEK